MEIEELIADGTFGRCLKVSYDHSEYAAKVIKPVKKYIEAALEEIALLKRMNKADNYEYSPVYIESFYFKEHYVIITSLHGDSLYRVMKNYNPKGFPLPIVRVVSRDIITAMSIMHSKANMAHTDLKPENIVFATTGRFKKFRFRDKKFYVPRCQRIKIIDYGNAILKEDFSYTTINTRQFRAPEVILKHQRWDHRSDIWSIGCILMEIFTGKILFPTSNTYEHLLMMEKVTGTTFPKHMVEGIKAKEVKPLFSSSPIPATGSYLKQTPDLTETLDSHVLKKLGTINELIDAQDNPNYERNTFKDLIKKLLTLDPNERITLEDALKHDFFDDVFEEEYEYLFEKINKHFVKDD